MIKFTFQIYFFKKKFNFLEKPELVYLIDFSFL